MRTMEFLLAGAAANLGIRDLVIAGWTGRDAATVERHIAELEAVGVRRPASVPCFYRVASSLLTTESQIDVSGSATSGEAEVVLIFTANGIRVGLGSDHTDRCVEAWNITVSKQVCPKPIARELWKFDEVREHWDDLVLRSWIARDGHRLLYQEGTAAMFRRPEDLIARYAANGEVPAETALFCGTLPLLAPIGPAAEFQCELQDPVLRRTISHRYAIRELPGGQ